MIITADGQVVPRGDAERIAAERESGEDGPDSGAVNAHGGMDAPAPLEARGEEEDNLEEVQEEAQVQARRAPKEPTRDERMRHEATHLPYRSWCPICVRGRGRNAPHLRLVEREQDGVPKICMD